MPQAVQGKRTGTSAALLSVAMELLAVGLFTLMAGANSEMGTIMVIFMIGFWMIFAITESGVVSGLGRALASLTDNPSNSGK